MGWVPVDPQIEELRDGLAANPDAVRREVAELLAAAGVRDWRLRPADRLRLLGLVVAAGRKLGDLEGAEAAAFEGSMIATRSPVANADFLNHVAPLRIVQERPADALRAVDQAAQLLAEELRKPQPASRESLRRRRWLQASMGAALVTRGEIFLHLSEGSVDGAFTDAFEALRLTSDLVKATPFTRRVHLAAVTLLCALLVRFGAPAIVEEAVRLLDHAERVLIYRCRTPPDHVHRIKIKWGRALTLARQGALPRAEALLMDVIERLIARGWNDDAKRALDALVWVIKQTKMPGRSGFYEWKYNKVLASNTRSPSLPQ
jgi:hypothetical protein